ncbi:MAG: glycosyltransferase [Candidatus Nanoarchaeia archaeon]
MKPEISVIMAAYEEPLKYITESVNSVLSQTFKNFELIVVLDKPENEEIKKTIRLLQKKDPRIIFLVNKNNIGRAETRNRAVSIAKGNYIAIMDADDISMKNRLAEEYKHIQKKNTDLLFSWAIFINEDGKEVQKFNPRAKYFKNAKKYLFKKNMTVHSTMLVRAEILKKLKYDPNFKRSQDFEFWIRCLGLNYKLDVVQKYLVKYRAPNIDNYEQRIKKQKMFYKYTQKALIKNANHFVINLHFWKRLIKTLTARVLISAIPDFLLKKYLKNKDKY